MRNVAVTAVLLKQKSILQSKVLIFTYQALTGTVLSNRCSKVATLNSSSSTSPSSRPLPFSSELAKGSHLYGAIWLELFSTVFINPDIYLKAREMFAKRFLDTSVAGFRVSSLKR